MNETAFARAVIRRHLQTAVKAMAAKTAFVKQPSSKRAITAGGFWPIMQPAAPA
jgi:hypothetical protein